MKKSICHFTVLAAEDSDTSILKSRVWGSNENKILEFCIYSCFEFYKAEMFVTGCNQVSCNQLQEVANNLKVGRD